MGVLVGSRIAGVLRGSGAALGGRGVALGAALITVPLIAKNLGPEEYGAFLAIQSIMAWIGLADLGIANQLTNLLSVALGRNEEDRAREGLASALALTLVIAAALLAIGVLAWPSIDWRHILGISSEELGREVALAAGISLILGTLELPLSLVDKVMLAARGGIAANLWTALGSLLSVVGLMIAAAVGPSLTLVVVVSFGVPIVVRSATNLWAFVHRWPELRPHVGQATRRSSRHLVEGARWFFIAQLASLLLYSTDNLIIASQLGASRVGAYGVTWKVLGVSQLFGAATFAYLWTAYSEAIGAGDKRWVKKFFRISIMANGITAVVVLTPLCIWAKDLIRVWAGEGNVPSTALVLWMAAWYLQAALALAISAFLNGTGRLRVQAWAGLATAIVNIALSFAWARSFGVEGVIAATVVSFLFCGLLPTGLVALQLHRRLGENLSQY